jgi:hypothetical protein
MVQTNRLRNEAAMKRKIDIGTHQYFNNKVMPIYFCLVASCTFKLLEVRR